MSDILICKSSRRYVGLDQVWLQCVAALLTAPPVPGEDLDSLWDIADDCVKAYRERFEEVDE